MVADEAQRSRSFGAGTGTAWPPRGRWGVDEVGPERLNLEPATAYEVVTRQMVEGLGTDLREIKGRLNGLLFLVAGAVVVDLALRLAGTG